MYNKSKAKGNAFEAEVAKVISLWLSNGKSAYWLERRTAGSGGAPRDVRCMTGLSGDIFPLDPHAADFCMDLNFEVKAYKDLTGEMWKWCIGEPSKIDDFLKQAKVKHKDYYCLVIKSNNRTPIVLTNRRFGRNSKQINGIFVFSFNYFKKYR